MNKPPNYPFRLLKIFSNPDYLEEIEGDLLERYEQRLKRNKPARLLLWIDVIKLIRPSLLRQFNTQNRQRTTMFNHNIKVSFRNFKRHKTSFFINYIGLVAGLVTVLFIYLWVNHELKVDRFHEDGDQIYRLVSGNGSENLLNTNAYFAWELEEALPEIEYVVNSCWGPLYSWLASEDKSFGTKGEFGGKRFFELFSYPLLIGDASSVLDQPNAIVLSESMAMKLFNSTDVIGKQIEWRWYSHEQPVVITGIVKDPPKNSSEQFDYVLNFEVYKNRSGDRLRNSRSARTYLKLKEGASPALVNQKIHDYTRATYPDYDGRPLMIIDYAGYYLENIYENGVPVGGRIEQVRLFIVIGALILIIACVNFMNLSTARAVLRTKEIGVRKTMGAFRKSLIFQFMTEACMISIVAGISATVLLFLLFPFFQNALDQQIHLDFGFELIIGFVGIVLLTGFLSGSYPALYLSKFDPLKILKGPFVASAKDQWFRKGLVVFQFGTSLILIIAVFVMYKQMDFIQTKSLGYQKDYIINFRTTGMTGSKQKAFLDQVRNVPGVVKAGGISHALFGALRAGSNMNWEGKDPEQEVWFEYGNVGYDMMELLEIELAEGRFFSKEFGDETTKVIINEETRKIMQVQSAVGKKFMVGETQYEIIGVTKNFHFQSLHEEIKPTFFSLNSNDWYLKIALKIESNQMKETLPAIEDVYSRFNPGFPFQYSFHDQDQAEMYETEAKIGLLTKSAAALAILISSLGLFGLVSFITERKSKEVGIRKVLGASSMSIIKIISKDFILPISIASVLGVGASTLLINQWLNDFAYHIELQWWFFLGSILLLVLIATLTSLTKVVGAISQNPVETLRDE